MERPVQVSHGKISPSLGLTVTGGRLLVDGRSVIESEGSVTLGDGASSANDCTVEFMPAAKLTLATGLLNYKNVSADSWIMDHIKSHCIISSGTTLYLYEDLNTDGGMIEFEIGATLKRETGAELLGATRGTRSIVVV